MIPIRKRISRPFLGIIIIIPITIMVLFNIIVSFYTMKQAEEDLVSAVTNITKNLTNEDNIKPNLPNRPKDNLSNSNNNIPNMAAIINNQTHSNSVELVVFGRNGELSKLFSSDSFVTDELAKLIYEEAETLDYNEIGSVRFSGETYYIVEVEYKTQAFTDKVVYISQGLIINDFARTINIVLLIISVIVTLISLFISTRVTSAIATPIERLTSLVETMKSDEILVINHKSDSLELNKLTDEINLLNRRIYNYHKSQKNFLHNASHELRTPLMSIQGYADGIEMGIFEDYKGTAHLISNQSKRLTKLVESLLKLAQVENFSTNKKLEKLNLSDEILDLINSYNGYAISENVLIKTDIVPNLLVNSNEELLQGAVGNIISNAIRYAKNSVTISLHKDDNKAIITIRDDGNGITDLDKIFDRFSKGEDGNFGLGLSIAKTSIEIMNGDIKVYNDSGAVFEIILSSI